jgi:phosphotransferase system HPr (HPr) family protein
MPRREPINPGLRLSRKMLVTNPCGLHARPTSELVRCAIRFKSRITIEANGRVCSAISIMDIMTADIRAGAQIIVTADGPDAERAIESIERCLRELSDKGL